MKLFLDDERYPPTDDWLVARGIDDFQIQIRSHGAGIELISFDHDLGQTINGIAADGYDCAKWLVNWLNENPGFMPKLKEIRVHSMNPVGAKNIIWYFRSAQVNQIINSDVKLDLT